MQLTLKNLALEIRKKYWRKGNFGSNVLLLSTGSAIAQILFAIASPIITRLYTPAEYGIYAIYLSIVSLLCVAATLRYELAIPLPKTDKEGFDLMIIAVGSVLATTLLIGLLLGLWQWHWGFSKSVLKEIQSFAWFLPIGLFFIGIYQTLHYWAIRIKAFSYLFSSKVGISLTQIFIQIGAGFLHFGPLGLIGGDVFAFLVGGVIILSVIIAKNLEFFKPIPWQTVKAMALRYRSFPLISTWSGIINTAGLQLPPILFIVFFGINVGGFFLFAQKIARTFLLLLGDPISKVFLSELAQIRDMPTKIRNLYFKLAKHLILVGMLPFGTLAIFSPPLFRFIFGAQWTESGIYLQCIAYLFLIEFVISPLSQILIVLEKLHWQLFWDLGRLIFITLAIWIAYSLKWSAIHAIILYGISGTIAYGLLFKLHIDAIQEISNRDKNLSTNR